MIKAASMELLTESVCNFDLDSEYFDWAELEEIFGEEVKTQGTAISTK